MAELPFTFGRIADADHFTDRDDERARLRRNFTALVNTVIVSPRRWGKSSLVARAAAEATAADRKLRVCRIDVFNVRDEAGFYSQLAQGVLRATSTRLEEWVQAAKQFLGRLRPNITFTAADTPQLTLDLDWDEVTRTPDDVLDLAENLAKAHKVRLVVCVDEFQAVGDFKDALAFQRKLRSHWQQHENVCYCLYGSKRHMLVDIFTNPSMPFYRFADVMQLAKIDNANWGDYIRDRFAQTGKSISVELARDLAARVENHSYYVQQVALQAWFRTRTECTPEIVAAALDDLADQLDLLFTGLVGSLTAKQASFLQAVLDGETALSSQSVLQRYRLGTSANVTRTKEALAAKEIIDVTAAGVEILDPVFAYWLRTRYLSRA